MSKTLARAFSEIDAIKTALEEIKRLHSARIMPDGQMWCDICCFDESGQQTEDCAQIHDHLRWTAAACSTTEIIVRAGL